MDLYSKIYEACKKYSNGQEFGFLKYNQCIKNPVIWNHLIDNVEGFNQLYRLLYNSNLAKIERTPSGGIKKYNINHAIGAWDCEEKYNKKGILKGVFLTVIIKNTVFVFKVGNFRSKDGELSGYKTFAEFSKICKNENIDLESYAINNGEEIKKQIESPIIRNYYLHEEISHVNHIDLNQAWPSSLCEVYPEFKPVIHKLRAKGKLYSDIAMGFMQSEYIGYRYAHLAKIGINGCNKKIRELRAKLLEQGFDVIGVNTDGIYYKDNTNQNRLYHDDNEGIELGQWKHDYVDFTFYAHSDGQYYLEKDGKYKIKARGFYSYERNKPREQWDRTDFLLAVNTVTIIEFIEGYGFYIKDNRNEE